MALLSCLHSQDEPKFFWAALPPPRLEMEAQGLQSTAHSHWVAFVLAMDVQFFCKTPILTQIQQILFLDPLN